MCMQFHNVTKFVGSNLGWFVVAYFTVKNMEMWTNRKYSEYHSISLRDVTKIASTNWNNT